MSRIAPLDLSRPIAHIEMSGRRIDVYPSLDYVRTFNALLERTGGATTDLVAQALSAAAQAGAAAASGPAAAVAAYDSGAPTSYALNPANPISTVANSALLGTAFVAAHTRTPAGMGAISLNAGSVQISRGVAYTLYYMDPTDAGGAVTYLATTDGADAADYAAGARIVGQAYIAPLSSIYGSGEQSSA